MSRKSSKASVIQVWVCVILAIACALLSFAPLITIETGIDETEREEMEMSFYEEFGSEIEIPEAVGISASKICRGIFWFVQMYQRWQRIDNIQTDNLSEEELEAVEQEIQKFEKEEKRILTSKEGKDVLVLMLALTSYVENGLDADTESENTDASIMTSLFAPILPIVFLSTFIYILLFPVVYVLTALFTLLSALANKNNSQKAARKVSLKLINRLGFPYFLMLCQFLLPKTNLAVGFWGILVLTFLSLIVNFVATRSYPYSKKEGTYITTVQFGSLVAAIGCLVLFFNILKTDVFTAFFFGKVLLYVNMGFESFENVALIDFFFTIMLFSLILSYFLNCTHRISLATKLRDRGHHIGFAIFLLCVSITLFVVSNIEHLSAILPEIPEEVSSLWLTFFEDIKTPLISAIVGAAVALLAEIIIAILSASSCKNISRRDKEDLLNGIKRIGN